MSKQAKGGLAVLLDGQAMPEEEARAFWARFSAWMDANKGDLGGFAKSEGLVSVHPTMQDGRPVLVASKSAAQKAYTNAPTVKSSIKAPGGSSAHHPKHPTAASSAARPATRNGKPPKN